MSGPEMTLTSSLCGRGNVSDSTDHCRNSSRDVVDLKNFVVAAVPPVDLCEVCKFLILYTSLPDTRSHVYHPKIELVTDSRPYKEFEVLVKGR